MPQNDTPLALANDIPASLGILSRIPVEVNHEAAKKRGAASSWAYPIAGAVIGGLSVCAGWISILFGLPEIVTTAVILTSLVMIPGAMHEDGLADTFDGLWGGYTKERRLEIMKDSHIGVYGVLALVISIAVRFGLLLVLVQNTNLWSIVAIAALSRAPMVLLMAKMPPARDFGLSHSVGRPRIETALLAVLIALSIGFVLLGGAILHGVVLTTVVVAALAYIANSKIGGQTGDILGASQPLSEIAFLAAYVSLIA
jgi:adenosylcobinamide-GDP ribazoletransferase